MEKSTSTTIRLGIFVTLGVLIFTVAVYLIGQKQHMFSETFQIAAHFNNVNGLQPGNNVRLSGINVGAVTEVNFLNDSVIEVKMRIKESIRMHIKQNSIASIGTDGLMGNVIVNIAPGKGFSRSVKNNELIQTYSRIKTDDILNTLNVTNDNAAMLTHNLLEITQHIKSGKGTFSAVLYDSVLEREVLLTIKNLRLSAEKTNSLLQELNTITKQVKEGRGTIGSLLNDTLLEDQVRTTLVGLQKTGNNLQAVSDSLQTLLMDIKEGDGTLPVLLYDTAVASNVKHSLRSIEEGTASFNENMEALKHSMFFKKYFKEQEKQKKKTKK
ncbi:MAG: MCE family protein [Cyclobacteriaceae bacterium]|nr:MCE family protein [Cyclobacteriaceae bacterium]